jgi:hypothetical protein
MDVSNFEDCNISTTQGRTKIVAKLRDLAYLNGAYPYNGVDLWPYMKASFSDLTNPSQGECWRNITNLVDRSVAWNVQTTILCSYLIHNYYHESCSEETSESPERLYEARTLFFDLFKLIYLNDIQRQTHGYKLHVIMYFCLYMSYQHYYLDSDVPSSLWNLYIDGLFYYLHYNAEELAEVICIYKNQFDTTLSSPYLSPDKEMNLYKELLFYYKTITNNNIGDCSLPILDSSHADYHSNMLLI